MITIEGNEERIDEAIEELTMSSLGYVHMNMLNHNRQWTHNTVVKSASAMNVASAIQALNDAWGERNTERFIHLFREDKVPHECEAEDFYDYDDDYCEGCQQENKQDARGMSDRAMERFYDFCNAFDMTWKHWFVKAEAHEWLPIVIDFTNFDRDILIDEDKDAKLYRGRFTVVKERSRYFKREDVLPLYADIKGSEEE